MATQDAMDSSTRANLKQLTVMAYKDLDTHSAPEARSGHRVFTDDNFLYVVGGFKPTQGGSGQLFREMWQLNLLTLRWTSLNIPIDFPTVLASFSLCTMTAGRFLLFGGTGLPFGHSLETSIRVCGVHGQDVVVQQLFPRGSKAGCYGHSMVYDESRDLFYVIAGTNGHEFRLDVDALDLTADQGRGEWQSLASRSDDGVYRLETILSGDVIFMFGGGTPHMVKGFETIQTFDVASLLYGQVTASPDPVHFFPAGRRCHSLSQWKRKVIIAGGCSEDRPRDEDVQVNVVDIFDDVWEYDLDTNAWRFIGLLPIPVFFHDSAVTKDGLLLIFGGVVDPLSRLRTNETQMMWLIPPSLFFSALQPLRKNIIIREEQRLGDKPAVAYSVFTDLVSPA